jgi:hypothetical protein
MICLANARESQPRQRRQLISTARTILKKLQIVAQHNPHAGLHKVYLIEAEIASVEGNRECAMTKYYQAIALAGEEENLHLQALACERAGVSMREFGERELADRFLGRALVLYEKWGATAIADRLSNGVHYGYPPT